VTRRGLAAACTLTVTATVPSTKTRTNGFWAVYDSPTTGQPRKTFYFSAIIREARDRQVLRLRLATSYRNR
jgi:hypothetical protein